MELTEAKERIHILKQMSENPHLIFTKLFQGNKEEEALYRCLSIHKKAVRECITNIVSQLPAFKDTILQIQGSRLYVYMPSLKYGNHQELQPDDKIAEIDMAHKSFMMCNQFVRTYSEVMEAEYKLDRSELPTFWKNFDNFNIKTRIKNAFQAFQGSKGLHVKLFDFFFILVVPKRKIDAAVDQERKKAMKRNAYNLKVYNDKVNLRKYYLKKAPSHIELCHAKQQNIKGYLTNLGYKEENGNEQNT